MKKASLSSNNVADWVLIIMVLVGGLVLLGIFVIGPLMSMIPKG